MKSRQEQKFDDQIYQITNGVQPDDKHLMAGTMECAILSGLEKKRLEEIMQSDHDAWQLEQYLLEIELILS